MIDYRTKKGREIKKELNNELKKHLTQSIVAGVLLGFVVGATLTSYCHQLKNPKIELLAPPQTMIVKEVEAVTISCNYDPITYIRCRGEQLNQSNEDIMTMIRIAKAESGLREDAIGKNSNGTYDIGVFQINDVHNAKISRADRFDFVKNIDYAWELKIRQGFNPWSVCKNGKVDC